MDSCTLAGDEEPSQLQQQTCNVQDSCHLEVCPRYLILVLYQERKTMMLAILQAPTVSLVVKELNLSYHNPETILFGTYPYYGNLN